ncbi:uncharacterized protein LOC116931135 isoform X1 [Daphnia magna]|uniref:uncharacterized protein LOC116931135 isoform X1 n=1 Tax=Daphnia magna TaxID=35525 RepID=UPI0006DD6D25|nr:uncharacterized protein LOC116931135 isoform X1 [Daphnia magna]XP_045034907.1 uncharacterized protein LOC116931135 isoform X1 [Daphnia magna]
MPSSNPVYQPTTVTYERHKEWSTSYITERVFPGCYQKPHLQRLLLVGAILLAILGLGLAIYALVNDVNTHKDESADVELMPTFDDNSDENIEQEEVPETNESHDHETNVILGSIGICLILISLVMYVVFLQLKGMCRGILPQHHSQRSGNLNTSAGQPVHSETSHQTAISYKGVQQEPGALNLEPAAPIEEERHSLMDSKFQSTEAEAPPIPKRSRSTPSRFCKRGRIGAPLASTETLSPSLASSFCSDIIFFDDQSSCHGDMDESSYSQVPSLYLQPSPVPSHSGGHSV